MRWGPPKIRVGERYGRLSVVAALGSNAKGRREWRCKCDCGNDYVATSGMLLNSRSAMKSCGCYKRERIAAIGRSHATHGMEGTPEYKAWTGLRKRCADPKNPSYPHYGGRGISVCERWQKFENFFSDMGYRPSPKHSIDRKDVNGNYEPGNCRWATAEEQAKNRTDNLVIEYEGRRQTLCEWAAEVGIGRATIGWRLKNGWSVERALTTQRYGWSKRWHG